jgi:hypothetical protein
MGHREGDRLRVGAKEGRKGSHVEGMGWERKRKLGRETESVQTN